MTRDFLPIGLSPSDIPLDDGNASARERKRWTGAILASGVFHAVLLALLIGLWTPIPEESPPLPIPVILREGTGAAGAIGGGNGDTAASASSTASESTAPAAPTEAPQPQPEQATAPQPAETPIVALPSNAPPASTDEVANSSSIVAEPVPLRKPTPPTPPQAAAPTPAPSPPVKTASPPAPTGPATPAPSASSSATANADAPPESGVGGRGRGEEGRGRAAYGTGSADGPGDDYIDRLQRWIARFRSYPEEAKTKKQEGTASIGFELARDGTVLDAWIAQSSGFPLLDQAALKMIHDASPVPKVPENYKGETLRFKAMPEEFHIGTFDRLFH
jgi:periplasmic protein TonB